MRESVYFAKKVFFARIFDPFFQIIISGENERQEGKGEEDRFRSQRERERSSEEDTKRNQRISLTSFPSVSPRPILYSTRGTTRKKIAVRLASVLW